MIQKVFAVLGIVLVFALAITACTVAQSGAEPALFEVNDLDEKRTVTVTGIAEMSVDPDEAYGVVGVETINLKADLAQKENAEKMEEVMAELKAAGISKNDIETQNYYLYREERWNPDTRQSEFRGYRVTNEVKFKTSDIENVGKYLDAAVEAGANKVHSIQFGLSEKAKEKLSVDLLTKAAETGKAKAVILAEALDARVGQVLKISESNYDVRPVYAPVMEAKALGMDAETPISPQEVTTNARVSLTFELI